MKKIFLICALIAIAISAPADVMFQTTGFGQIATTTGTPILVSGFAANIVAVYNVGTNTVFAQVNSTATGMTAAMVTTNAVPIPSGGSFMFNTYGKANLMNVVVTTLANGLNSTFYVGAY